MRKCKSPLKGTGYLAPNSRPGHDGVTERILATYPKSPSVASVTSVRCFPLELILARHATVLPRGFWPPTPNSPSVTSVASVRCFPLALILAGRDEVTERILATHRKSPSVASVTSVRCFPLGANSRPGRDGVAERILATYRKSPSVASVTSVRCFFSFDEFSHRSRLCPHQQFLYALPM